MHERVTVQGWADRVAHVAGGLTLGFVGATVLMLGVLDAGWWSPETGMMLAAATGTVALAGLASGAVTTLAVIIASTEWR